MENTGMLEQPDFVGMNSIEWIVRAEMFFEEQEIQLCDKLQWEFMSMKGEMKPCFGFSHGAKRISMQIGSHFLLLAMIRRCRENASCSFAERLTIEEGEINLHAPGEMKRKKTQMVMGLGSK